MSQFYIGLTIGLMAGCIAVMVTAALCASRAADDHMTKLRTQCSVCGCVIAKGKDRRNLRNWLPSEGLIHDCSHGYCPDCAREAMKDEVHS